MFILFGYQRTYMDQAAEIRLFGIFETHEQCIERISKIGKIEYQGAPWEDNVIGTRTHVFWYKESDDLSNLNITVRNSRQN